MNQDERAEFADMVAQAVIDRIEQRRNVDMLVEMVLAQGGYICGVYVNACPECPQILGSPPCPCGNYENACLNCAPPDNCDDCQSVADYTKCQCLQALLNQYPGFADCNGNPTGNPGCVDYNTGVDLCDAQYNYNYDQC